MLLYHKNKFTNFFKMKYFYAEPQRLVLISFIKG